MSQNVYQRRLVGQQSGVQVNMPVDKTDRLLPEVGDQTIAVVGHFSRGRIDRPFFLSPEKLQRYLGKAKSIRLDSRNETYLQVYEALKAGAAGAVISRLSSDAAISKYITLNADGSISAAETLGADYLLAVKMADAIEQGVYVTFAAGSEDGYVRVTIRELDKNSAGFDTDEGYVLYEFEGSCVAGELDENGNSAFIDDMASRFYGDWLKVVVAKEIDAKQLADAMSKPRSAAVIAFEDKGTVAVENKTKAVTALGRTNIKYRYLVVSSNDIVINSQMMALAQEFNRKIFIEVPGELTPEAAAAWIANFNYSAQGGMYFDFNWSPLRRDDPLGISGNVMFGTVGQKAGAACARNAITNGHGLAKLNQPIAGKDYFITGDRIAQVYFPDDTEMALLAKARINPAISSEYHDGSGYVWADSFSGAKKNGISKLASAAEIAIWAQDQWGKFGKSLLQKPMKEGIQLMSRFSTRQLQAMEASDWLIPSEQLGGKAWAFSVAPNERYPDDRLDTILKLSIDGVVRVVNISTEMYSRN